MWPTPQEVAYYKRIGNNETATDQYYIDMLPLVLEHINEECTQTFSSDKLTANVKLFLAQAIAYFSKVDHGLKSESVSSVSFSYDFSELPKGITKLLEQYGYGRKGNYAQFFVY